MQGVQSLLPQRPVADKTLIYFCERCGAKTVDPPLRLLAGLDQPRFSQDSEVAGDARTSERQQLRQRTRSRRTAGQRLQQRPSALVGDRPQDTFHAANVPRRLRNCQGTYIGCSPSRVSRTSVAQLPSLSRRAGGERRRRQAPATSLVLATQLGLPLHASSEARASFLARRQYECPASMRATKNQGRLVPR